MHGSSISDAMTGLTGALSRDGRQLDDALGASHEALHEGACLRGQDAWRRDGSACQAQGLVGLCLPEQAVAACRGHLGHACAWHDGSACHHVVPEVRQAWRCQLSLKPAQSSACLNILFLPGRFHIHIIIEAIVHLSHACLWHAGWPCNYMALEVQ